jgi:hypothetical protein
MPSANGGLPVQVGPRVESSQWLVERTTQLGQLVERRRLGSAGIELPSNETVAFSPPQRVGEDLVGDPLKRTLELLVAATAIGELSQDGQSPSSAKQADDLARLIPAATHEPLGWFR